jgi:hypothetical protein
MNLARIFSYTKELESQRQALRERVCQLEDDQKKLIDALARNANKQAVFERAETKPASTVPPIAFGPTMAAQRQAAIEEEQAGKIEAARNGSSITIPHVPYK